MNEHHHEVIRISNLSLTSIQEKRDGSTLKTILYHECELSARHKELVVILGSSGAGKTLLTHLLLNLESAL